MEILNHCQTLGKLLTGGSFWFECCFLQSPVFMKVGFLWWLINSRTQNINVEKGKAFKV